MKYSTISLWGKRFFWLGLIWLLSIVTLGIIAYSLRFLMSLAGMTTSA